MHIHFWLRHLTSHLLSSKSLLDMHTAMALLKLDICLDATSCPIKWMTWVQLC